MLDLSGDCVVTCPLLRYEQKILKWVLAIEPQVDGAALCCVMSSIGILDSKCPGAA